MSVKGKLALKKDLLIKISTYLFSNLIKISQKSSTLETLKMGPTLCPEAENI